MCAQLGRAVLLAKTLDYATLKTVYLACRLQQRLAAAAAASKERNSLLLQELEDTAQPDASCSPAANVQVCNT